jgi:acetyltransferase-like isoleucine patch superfamily enzyme
LDWAGEVEERPLPHLGAPPYVEKIPRSLYLAAHVKHWVHVLWLNQLLPRLRLEELFNDDAVAGRIKGTFDPTANRIGRDCKIHEKAHLEGSILAAGAHLGPFTSLRDCYAGLRVAVGDHTRFKHSVIGDDCHTLADSYFIGCTAHAGATLSNFNIKQSIFGQKMFITTGVIVFSDEPQGKTIIINNEEGVFDTGKRVLGGCFGHRTTLGVRAIFEPGLAVPNGYMITMRPEEAVFRIKSDLPASPDQPVCWDNGALKPLSEVAPGFAPPDYASPPIRRTLGESTIVV